MNFQSFDAAIMPPVDIKSDKLESFRINLWLFKLFKIVGLASWVTDDALPWQTWCIEFLAFGVKQAWACLFGGLLLLLILTTHYLWPEHSIIARYDILFLGAVFIQAALLSFHLETIAEAKVILIFHIVGTAMELFKTHMGSWEYPENNLIRLSTVPLFSGFMYASVGSYIARVIRLIDMRYDRYPPRIFTYILAAAIYLNFFTHHFIPDIRGVLFIVAGVLFGRTRVYFRPWRRDRHMSLLLGFCLVTLFIWFAENIGTFGTIWLYPQQRNGWHMVGFTKIGSWFLLMLISFILVTTVHRPRTPAKP